MEETREEERAEEAVAEENAARHEAEREETVEEIGREEAVCEEEESERDLMNESDENLNLEEPLEFRFSCRDCGAHFVERADLEKHAALAHGIKICLTCRLMYSEVDALAEHMSVEHDECYQCAKDGVKCKLCQRRDDIAAQREGAKKRQMREADRMIENTRKKLKVVDVGDTVMLPVPDVDKGKIDQNQLPAIIIEVTDSGMYKLGTR